MPFGCCIIVKKFLCCIDLKTGVYTIAFFLTIIGVFPAYSLISRGTLSKICFYSAVKAVQILATIFLLIGTQTGKVKFITIWLVLASIAWFAYPLVMVIFIIWLHRQPVTPGWQERTIDAEIITLAVVVILVFVLMPYFLVVVKSFRSELKEKKPFGQHV